MQRSPGLTVLFALVLGASNHMLDRGQRSARWSGCPSPAHGPRGPRGHTRAALASHRLDAGPTVSRDVPATAPGQGWALQTVYREDPGPPTRPGSAVCARGLEPGDAGVGAGQVWEAVPSPSGTGCSRHPAGPLRKRLQLPRAERANRASSRESPLDSAVRECSAHAASPGETHGQTPEVRRGSRQVCAPGPRALGSGLRCGRGWRAGTSRGKGGVHPASPRGRRVPPGGSAEPDGAPGLRLAGRGDKPITSPEPALTLCGLGPLGEDS